MRRSLLSLSILSALSFVVPACGGTSGGFRGNGTGIPVDSAQVQVVNSKDELSDPYKELGTVRAKAPSAEEAIAHAKEHCGRGGGGDLLIMNTEPFQSGSVWRVDASCAKSDKPVATPKAAGSSQPNGTGKPIG